ncbi:hypothetical protein C437_15406 [Haloarcula vallismortis ATCC 29715]|uniref:Uncharacterized protein n=1 Tax=Haloarcula vallismortis ATCC 29715 TaxID=662477 RepID=M0J1A8_HALVA|nr:hypothetical protein C437_15406 [Haloarcula vallismortis ATCC 29715]
MEGKLMAAHRLKQLPARLKTGDGSGLMLASNLGVFGVMLLSITRNPSVDVVAAAAILLYIAGNALWFYSHLRNGGGR